MQYITYLTCCPVWIKQINGNYKQYVHKQIDKMTFKNARSGKTHSNMNLKICLKVK